MNESGPCRGGQRAAWHLADIVTRLCGVHPVMHHLFSRESTRLNCGQAPFRARGIERSMAGGPR